MVEYLSDLNEKCMVRKDNRCSFDLIEAVLEEFNSLQFQQIFGSWKFGRISKQNSKNLKLASGKL